MEERIHVLDTGSGEVLHSFFRTPVSEEKAQAAFTVGLTSISVRGDSLATTFALSDSIYFFTKSGERNGSIQIPIRQFRPVRPPPEDRTNGAAIRAWIDSFTMISEVFWFDDGDLIVQYQDRVNMLPEWRLLGMRRDGRRVFDLVGTPRLYTASGGGQLYFADPESLTPNVLAVARLTGE
jgi:hypothetical protein